ncbi:MAG: aspartate--tRNA ligase [Clostridiales bacterium]|jgi:aspartyl-tRNA synthetase|nr:aspartate--tRNA ligase [Clostridiales bacterium]
MKRTIMCGQLNSKNIGETVVIQGWVAKTRDLGGVIFIDVRDREGIVQAVANENLDKDSFKVAESLAREYVVQITGEVKPRSSETINKNIPTGEIEVIATNVVLLNKAETPPFEIEADIDTNEQVRLKYRYLDLRRPDMQKNIIMRHKIAKIARDYFDENGFLEIETPMLTKSTPEGARDYLVPSRVNPGHFYALPQSPQLYKQLLMLSGMDRYFQIVRCFRDEDLRADRQPEFTQMDLEMSFVDQDDVISINEGLIARVMKEVAGVEVKTPFVRMPYNVAMQKYGSDKPDTRFGMELVDTSDVFLGSGFKTFSDIVSKVGSSARAICVKGGVDKLSRRDLDALTDFVKIYGAKGMAWINVCEDELKSPIAKFLTKQETDALLSKTEAEVGDTILFVADKNKVVFDSLGALRCELATRLNLIDKSLYNFLWVVDFPLLEYDDTEKRYTAKHHPFTAPNDSDISLMETNPGEVRAKAYDIILNGNELGGGSLRIYNTELQEKMFKLLGFTTDEAWARFGFLMEAFKYGTPPHGGMAYGLDRFAMILAGADSIRDVIAFPKVQTASEVMSNAPNVVDIKQLEELHIKVVE